MTRFSSEARKACVTPTDQMFTKGAARISTKKSNNSEHEVTEDEDPARDAHMVKFVIMTLRWGSYLLSELRLNV